MIHGDPCEGLGMRACESCARHVERYTERALAAHPTRLRPLATPPRCVDWQEMPQRSIDPTHSKL